MPVDQELQSMLIDLGLETINGFGLQYVRGTGRNGILCNYEHKITKEQVAVKFLIAPGNPDSVAELIYEANVLLKGLVETELPRHFPKGISTVEKHPKYPVYYFMMEFIHGETLHELDQRKRKQGEDWKPEEVVSMMWRICSAVSQINAVGYALYRVRPSWTVLG